MKSILMSIKPKWVEKIASGEKTVEVRKSVPKCGTPFKVYMYCTNKSKNDDEWQFKPYLYLDWKKRIRWIDVAFESIFKCEFLHGKVVGEFVCDKIEYFDSAWSEYAYAVAPSGSISGSIMPMHEDTAIKLCETKGAMTLDDIIAYFGDEDWKAHFLHISDLKIYDKPKDIGEFSRYQEKCCKERDCKNCNKHYVPIGYCEKVKLTRPPQSWQFVEEMEVEEL